MSEMSIALAKSLDTKARVTAGELLGELVEMHDWNLGPNVRNPNEFPRSVKLHRRMEDILTQQLGHEVRHIGMWNEPKLNPLSKRQEKQHPVFALQHGRSRPPYRNQWISIQSPWKDVLN